MEVVYPLVADSWGEEEVEAIERVVKSRRFTMGEEVKAFEKEFAQKVGSKYAVMVNSGSSANLIAVFALRFYEDWLWEDYMVLVPAIGWSTSYSPFYFAGMKLKVVDVELNTLNIDFAKLEKAVSGTTMAVLAINILGNPCDLPRIRSLCDSEGLCFIEDNCESLGAEVYGKQCGTWGDVGTFSFFFSHHISTMEGGMIVTDNEEIAHITMELRAHGWTRDLPKDSPIYQKPANWRYENYDFAIPGFNLRPLEIEAAVGREQLKKLDKFVGQRRKNAEVFTELFCEDDRFIIQKENGKSSWFDFSIILNPKCKIDREKVWDGLKMAGIEFRPITGGNFVQHRAADYYNYQIFEGLPNATLAHDNGFFVGNFHFDISDKIEYLHKVLTKLVF